MSKEVIESYLGNDKSDPVEKIIGQIETASNYTGSEIGLYHPQVFSTVKLRDNGMVDIFTSGNQGVRIDPKTCSINFFANHIKEHIYDHSVWANELIYDIDKAITLDIDNTIVIASRDRLSIKLTNGNKVSIEPTSMQITFGDTSVIASTDKAEIQCGNNKCTINKQGVTISNTNHTVIINDNGISLTGTNVVIDGTNVNINGNVRINNRDTNRFIEVKP